jgi:arsenate reductase (thioredoxin)
MTMTGKATQNGGMINILFLCAHNSARSILAEALLNRLGAGRFEAHSAGFEPASTISPYALALLSKINYNTHLLTPKGLDVVMSRWAPVYDYVIRLSPESAEMKPFPVLSGQPNVIDWFIDDPMRFTSKAQIASAYEDLFNQLANRLDIISQMSSEFLRGPRAVDYLEGMGEGNLRLAS